MTTAGLEPATSGQYDDRPRALTGGQVSARDAARPRGDAGQYDDRPRAPAGGQVSARDAARPRGDAGQYEDDYADDTMSARRRLLANSAGTADEGASGDFPGVTTPARRRTLDEGNRQPEYDSDIEIIEMSAGAQQPARDVRGQDIREESPELRTPLPTTGLGDVVDGSDVVSPEDLGNSIMKIPDFVEKLSVLSGTNHGVPNFLTTPAARETFLKGLKTGARLKEVGLIHAQTALSLLRLHRETLSSGTEPLLTDEEAARVKARVLKILDSGLLLMGGALEGGVSVPQLASLGKRKESSAEESAVAPPKAKKPRAKATKAKK